jgi:ABC-2 type transport system permease protein
MTTTDLTSPPAISAPVARWTTAPPTIPLKRIVAVELRKSVDTRAGLWLMVGVGVVSLLTTGAVMLWADAEDFTQATFTSAISIPMSVLLPIIAVLSVTAEWSQRSGLTTFTLVPHRGRIVAAKAMAAAVIGVAATVVAFTAGALGNVLGTTLGDHPTVWDQGVTDFGLYSLSNVLTMMVGFTLGVLIRNSPGAIVAYFIWAFVAPPLLMALAYNQEWFADAQPWVDPNHAQGPLLQGALSGEQWTQLAVTTVTWLLLPLAVGIRTLLRSEVK